MTTKVLHIMSGFGGGISSFILNKARARQNEGIVFDVLTYDEVSADFAAAIHSTGGTIHKMVNPKTEGWKPFKQKVSEVMDTHGPYEMVHCHVTSYRALPFYLLAKRHGIKRFVIHAHTSGSPEKINGKKQRVDRRMNNLLANQFVSCGSKATHYTFGEKVWKKKEVMHVPNSIDIEQYLNVKDKAMLREEVLPEAKNKRIIGHVGRFHEVKNYPLMIDIIQELAKQGEDFLWVFVGTGDLFETVKADIAARGLGEYVTFLGRRNDMDRIYPLFDTFVLPSFYEGFPTVAVEAQASGVPCVLSDTITEEADLDMDLVAFLPIDQSDSAKQWAAKVLAFSDKIPPAVEHRRRVLEEKKFSNEASAALYESFVLGEIDHYEI